MQPKTDIPELILCDLDGTLADSMPYLYGIYKAFLASHGFEGSQEEFTELVGPPLKEVVAILRERYGLAPSDDTLYHSYIALLKNDYASTISLAEGARSFIQKARAHSVRLMIVTSASQVVTETFLAREKVADAFEAIIGAEDVIFGKPDPEPYLAALRRSGVSSLHAIAIEDSASGVASATGAGLLTYWMRPKKNRAISHTELIRPVHSWNELEKRLFTS